MKLFIFAGELSGDMHGGRLIQALRTLLPTLQVTGVAGPSLRMQGVEGPLSMEDFAIMGFSDVLRAFPRLYKQFYQLRDDILNTEPDVVLFVDAPSLSLRMARALRKCNYQGKIVQYVCPTVWAWGKGRTEEMAKTFDLLLTIYPFEAAHFSHTPLPVEYVGNPVHELIQEHSYDGDWSKLFGIRNLEKLVALFPGSRLGEIKRNLPMQLAAVQLMRKQDPETPIAISCAQESHHPLLRRLLDKSGFSTHQNIFFVPNCYNYDLMRHCRSAIAKSGTVTLELALHQTPTVVMYQLSSLNRLIAKYALRLNLPHYCIVNILNDKTTFPELIAQGCTPHTLYEQLHQLHRNGDARTQCLHACKQVQALFKEKDASMRAARAILKVRTA